MSDSKKPKAGDKDSGKARSSDRRVGQLLIEEGLINEDQLACALAVQADRGGRLFGILIALKLITKENLHSFLSKQSGVPSIDVKSYEIPRELISIVPREFAREHIVLPIDKLGKLLTVGMACPLDTTTIAELERITGLRVKAMLCKFDDIHATIQRYYPTERQVTYEEREHAPAMQAPAPAKKMAVPEPAPPERAPSWAEPVTGRLAAPLEQLELLPPLPDTVHKVTRAAEDPSGSIRELAGIISLDPAVTLRLLSVANAAAYGMPGRVTNINLAATLLGVQATTTLVKSFDHAPEPRDSPGFVYKAFWLRSMFCAGAAMSVAQAANQTRVVNAYTAGLLHDIGRLAFATAVPEAYSRVHGALPIYDVIQEEETAFGLAHPEAGYLLARRWNVPGIIADAIRFHHRAEAAEADDLTIAVALAAMMADAFERNTPLGTEPGGSYEALLGRLDMDTTQAAMIFGKISATLKTPPERKA